MVFGVKIMPLTGNDRGLREDRTGQRGVREPENPVGQPEVLDRVVLLFWHATTI